MEAAAGAPQLPGLLGTLVAVDDGLRGMLMFNLPSPRLVVLYVIAAGALFFAWRWCGSYMAAAAAIYVGQRLLFHARNCHVKSWSGGKPDNALQFTANRFQEPLDPLLAAYGLSEAVWSEIQGGLRESLSSGGKKALKKAIDDANRNIFRLTDCRAVYAAYGSKYGMTVYSADEWNKLQRWKRILFEREARWGAVRAVGRVMWGCGFFLLAFLFLALFVL